MQQGLLVKFSCNSPTLYLIAHWRALLVVRSFVLEWRVVATTPNNIKNLEGIGNVVWEFLSSIYDLHWDSLYVDNSNTTFRSKISSKFTPQVSKISNNNKEKEVVKPIFISPIPPPIPAKLQKEVNELSKYFKKKTNTQQKKSYAHATSSSKQSNSSALEMLQTLFSLYLHN